MPNRILRDWSDSDRFDGLSANAERLFVRLIMKADDYGRFHAESRRIRSACFPLALTLRPSDIDGWLQELAERRLIWRYKSEDSRDLLIIPRFNQRLKMSRAKFPPPPGHPLDWVPSDDFPELPGSSGKFPPESETDIEADAEAEPEKEKAADAAGFFRFWSEWPKHHRKANRKACLAAWNAGGMESVADDIVKHVAACKRSEQWLSEDGKYINAPLVYLHQRSFEAPPPPPPKAKPTKATPEHGLDGVGDIDISSPEYERRARSVDW